MIYMGYLVCARPAMRDNVFAGSSGAPRRDGCCGHGPASDRGEYELIRLDYCHSIKRHSLALQPCMIRKLINQHSKHPEGSVQRSSSVSISKAHDAIIEQLSLQLKFV